jgi:phosphoglycolate phosphatase
MQFYSGKYKVVVFDLDGTLVDSAPVLQTIINGMRKKEGLPPLPIELYKEWSSEGGKTMMSKAFDIPVHETDKQLEIFRLTYASMTTPANCIYPNAKNFLEALVGVGVFLAICTNKPKNLCDKVLQETGLADFFQVIVSGSCLAVKKPSPEPLLECVRQLKASASEVLFIGDSSIDKETSLRASIDFMLFKSGYDKDVEEAHTGRHFRSYKDLLVEFQANK